MDFFPPPVIRWFAVPVRSEARQGRLEARVKQLEAELAHERRSSAALREVGLAVGNLVDLNQLLELILSKITEVLHADRATLYLVDEVNKELVSRITVGDSVQTIRVKIGTGIAGKVAETGKSICVKDAYKDRRFHRTWDELTGYRTTSILAAPMKNHLGTIIGVVQALNKVEGPFSEADKSLLNIMATQAAITVDNSRLYISALHKNAQLVQAKEQLERHVRDLKLLFELESAVGHAESLPGLLSAALRVAIRACESEAGVVLFPDELSGELSIYLLRANSEEQLQNLGIYQHNGLLLQAIKSETGFTHHHFTEQHPETEFLSDALGTPLQSLIAYPLVGNEETRIGTVALLNKVKTNEFQAEDMSLLRLIAANVSTALQLYHARVAQQQAERLTTIGRLLSGVVHDLKTPMTVISGYVQLMANCEEPEKRQEYAEMTLKQFDLIQQMQREILQFARGEKSIFLRRVYLASFLRDFERSLRSGLENSKVKIEFEVQDRGVARFDEGKILRALHNLVRNALDAMAEKGGVLKVGVQRSGNDVTFYVSDTGSGIPKEIRKRMFESFVTKGKKGGTGLGLAIVKKVTDEHGGSVKVATSSRGTTFYLTLPQQQQ
jgi:signal transduction histidine kinase/putative methionine-R-sulfoxide reductase with GAF domain